MTTLAIQVTKYLMIVLIILIVQGVKLHNRNAEIDELYDEYGIDLPEVRDWKWHTPEAK